MTSPAKVRIFSLSRYVEAALRLAEYERDEDGVIVVRVPNAAGFFAQGDTYEEARSNLADVMEGNVLLSLQLGWDIPELPGFQVTEQDVETHSA